MPDSGSISNLIRSLKFGHNSAAGRLWDRYRHPITRVADSALGGSVRSVADEDDVALDAFTAFLKRTAEGAYPALQTRDDLWRVLVRVTYTYAWKQIRFFRRLKRSGDLQTLSEDFVLSSLASQDPPPDVVVGLSETLNQLLGGLPDKEIRTIAIRRLEGCTNEEIAAELNRSLTTIERRMRLIRECWSRTLENDAT